MKDIILKGDELFNTLLELSIKNHIQQTALIFTIAKYLSNGDGVKEDEIMDFYQSECERNASLISDDLYNRRGSFDINDILGTKPKE